MRWEDSVLGMLDDLELQAEGLHLAERAAEVDELRVAQYAEVELGARLHASEGSPVQVSTADGVAVRGRLAGAGADWLLLQDDRGAGWFVHLAHVVVVGGLDPRPLPAAARPVSARLSLRAVLRRLAADRQPCAVHLRGGRTLRGVLTGVGADFVEVRQGEAREAVTVPLAAVAVVQESGGFGWDEA